MIYYFDHAASSVIYPEALDILSTAQREDFANPSAQHILGQKLFDKIEDFRNNFLKALSADKNDVMVFTSSATESNNTVIKGLQLKKADVVLYCKADHPSLTAPIEYLAKEFLIELREISLMNDGTIDQQAFENQLSKDVKFVALTHVNNQSGVVNEVELLAKLVKEKSSAHVHVDAVQSFSKLKLKNSAIDSLSFTSHKIGGPKGVAGLILKSGHQVQPLILGGGQEKGMRSSTVAYPLIASFHAAMKISFQNKESSFSKNSKQSELIRARLGANIPSIEFPFKLTSPYIVSFILPGISSDIILRHLETRNVFISSTSACSSKISGYNSTLAAMNIPESLHKNFLRISLGQTTSESEVEILIKEFLDVWNSIKHIKTDGRHK